MKTLAASLLLAAALFAAPARADSTVPGVYTTPPTTVPLDSPATLPATLCAIGAQGNWCFGLLPTITSTGVDVKHGTLVSSLQVGTSLAATWMPGQLKSVTFGLHAGTQGSNSGVPMTFNIGGTLSLLRGWATIQTDWQAVGGSHAFVIAPALGLPL